VFAIVREGIKHPEQFSAQMQRVSEHVRNLWQRVESMPQRAWDNVIKQERVQYLARVRRQHTHEEIPREYDNHKQRGMSTDAQPQQQISAASLALIHVQEDRER
jgi:hypothetical protein